MLLKLSLHVPNFLLIAYSSSSYLQVSQFLTTSQALIPNPSIQISPHHLTLNPPPSPPMTLSQHLRSNLTTSHHVSETDSHHHRKHPSVLTICWRRQWCVPLAPALPHLQNKPLCSAQSCRWSRNSSTTPWYFRCWLSLCSRTFFVGGLPVV